MIAFFDTSALAKLYLDETNSSQAIEAFERADVRSASRLAWVETQSAFARRVRMGISTRAEATFAISQFQMIWDTLNIVEATSAIVEAAAENVWSYGLRGYDAVQLASALAVQRELEDPIVFVSFDHHLSKSAQNAGLSVLN